MLHNKIRNDAKIISIGNYLTLKLIDKIKTFGKYVAILRAFS